MAGPGLLSTILDTTGKRLQERLDMEKDFRNQQSKSIIDSIHAINADGSPKLTPEQQEQAWEELTNLNKAKGAKDIINTARGIFDMIGHGKKNPAMAQRSGEQLQSALGGGDGGNLVQPPPQQPSVSDQPEGSVSPTLDPNRTIGPLTDSDMALPYTPPPPGGRLQPVQQVANAAAQQPQPTPIPNAMPQQPTATPTPPPKRTSMASIIAAGSPTGQKIVEDTAAAKAQAQAQAEATKDVEGYKTTQVGPRTSAEEKAKLMATYGDPQVVDAMVRMKRLEMPAIVMHPGDRLGIPTDNGQGGTDYRMAGSAVPRIKPPEENLQDSAVLSVLKKHGQADMWDQMNPEFPFMQQLPKELQAEAAMEYERIKKTPDPGLEAMRVSMESMREVEKARIKQEMDQYSETQGPEAMEGYRQLVLSNPNSIAEVPIAVRGRLIGYMKSQGDRVPRILSGEMQQTDFNADQTLARISRVRDIIKKYPDLIGPVANAVGKGQEITGLALQDPEKAAAAADLRGSLEFLKAAETKAILGSRPAFQWANVFNSVTANQKDQAPVMEGALRMQEAHAKMIKSGIDDQRYGDQKADEFKTVNGVKYKRVKGGWQKVG